MTRWKIRVHGYGTFDFEGTEAEAEEMRKHKASWERGASMKWRANLAYESDKISAEIASLFDRGKGVPYRLFSKLKRAAATETRAALGAQP